MRPGTVRDFPDLSFSSLLTAPTRNSPERVHDTTRTFPEKSWKPAGLASLKLRLRFWNLVAPYCTIARLSHRYPPIVRYGVLGVSTWPSGCDIPSPFSERFP